MRKIILFLVFITLCPSLYAMNCGQTFCYDEIVGMCINEFGREGLNETISIDELASGKSGQCQLFENVTMWGQENLVVDNIDLRGAVFVKSSLEIYQGMRNALLQGADVRGLMRPSHHNYGLISGLADQFTIFPSEFCTLYEGNLLHCQ